MASSSRIKYNLNGKCTSNQLHTLFSSQCNLGTLGSSTLAGRCLRMLECKRCKPPLQAQHTRSRELQRS